ncbi:hypothetical protein EV361DRAFT_4900 [Lentinula raphanica]|uniref:Uncharacterized protein n=1 Tax=Lentinula raphanica TaxID=153919 RepID=A0AA38ULF0_9AGAR|nr:hypothetical protein F5880DRAFT_1153292 [Lentinula raphanica]KAJ3845534.1 hypothetical protein F5878DRAFT_1617 [Lentinula raphanica]KAJ3978158.1 hypothetical protein EV361DRAFT_4900 [Lentinula raphanica]
MWSSVLTVRIVSRSSSRGMMLPRMFSQCCSYRQFFSLLWLNFSNTVQRSIMIFMPMVCYALCRSRVSGSPFLINTFYFIPTLLRMRTTRPRPGSSVLGLNIPYMSRTVATTLISLAHPPPLNRCLLRFTHASFFSLFLVVVSIRSSNHHE